MIFLNEERFLPEAVESVLAQSYQDWELLLADDGSSDGSSAQAKAYTQQYPEKVRYLEHANHQNRGMSATRNLAIQHAAGDYITFLDADDVWLPDKLAKQVTLLEAHAEAAFVCAPARWWHSWSGDTAAQRRDFVQKLGVPLDAYVEPPALLLQFLHDVWASLCDVLVRRQAVLAVRGYEESFRGMFEDQAFHAKLCLRYRGYVTGECGYLYRQHSEACTAQFQTQVQYNAKRLAYLTWLEGYLATHKAKGSPVWQVVRRQLWPLRHPTLGAMTYLVKRAALSLWDKGDTRLQPMRQIRQLRQLPLREIAKTKLRRLTLWPPVGLVRFGNLRRVTPIGPVWPNERGCPLDRYYIENFLEQYAADIKGRVLELGDAAYTHRYGGQRVSHSDVLHAIEGNPAATIVADLTCADHIPSNTFDCIILTQTLLLIYDLRAAVRTLYRILKPGGVLLVTVPGITQIVRGDMEECGQYWSFTTLSAQRLMAEVFPANNIRVAAYGNVLATAAFLYGLASSELRRNELDYHDPDYEFIISVRAAKPEQAS